MRFRAVIVGSFVLATVQACPVWGGEQAGTESPLLVGTGARSLAMAGAATAAGTGAESMVFNPALLARSASAELSLFHSDLYSEATSLRSGFAVYPTLEFGCFGMGVQRLAVGSIDGRDERNGTTGEFDASETHVLTGYARSFHDWLTVGLALRIVQQVVAGTSATGAGLDFGIATDRPLRRVGHRWQSGLAIQNLVSPSLRLDEEEVADPRRLRFGLGYSWAPPQARLHAALAADLLRAEESDTGWAVGAELGLDRTVFGRAGLVDGRITAGIGIRVHGIELAYAMQSDEDLPREDRFSLSLAFGPTVSQRREDRLARQEAAIGDRLERMLRDREAEALEIARGHARRAYAEGEFEQAILLFGRVLLLDPENAEAAARQDDSRRRLALDAAEAEMAASAPGRAAVAFQRVLDRWPDDPEALGGLARAREAVNAVVDRQGQLRGLFSDALARFSRGELLAARASLRELLRVDPDHAAAVELLDRLEQTRTERIDAAIARAENLRAARNAAEARQVLLEVIGFADERESELRARIESLREVPAPPAKPVVAVETPARRSVSADARHRVDELFRSGMSAFESGEYATAARTWRDAWELAPQPKVGEYLVKAHLLLGVQSYSRGEYESALEHCRRVLEVDPENEKARRYAQRIEEERVSVRQIESGRNGR